MYKAVSKYQATSARVSHFLLIKPKIRKQSQWQSQLQ